MCCILHAAHAVSLPGMCSTPQHARKHELAVLAYKYEMADLLCSYDVEGYKSVAGTPALNGEPCLSLFITLTHCIFRLCIVAAITC